MPEGQVYLGEPWYGFGLASAPPPPPNPRPEGSGGPLPYLNFCGTEISNGARTLEYLRAGLGDTTQGRWIIGQGDLCSVLYRVQGGTCNNPFQFASPAADPAPWYDPTEAGANEFLGFVLLDIKGYDSTLQRQVTNRVQGLGGGTFSGQRRQPRVWRFRGALVSASPCGAEYGLRWLTNALQAGSCDSCSTCYLAVRLCCPPGDCSNEDLGLWASYDVALTEGPTEVQSFAPDVASVNDSLAGCRDLVLVEFTLTAGNPFLYRTPTTCLAPTIVGATTACTDFCTFFFGNPGTRHGCFVQPPARGTLGAIFTFTSTSGMGPVLLEAYGPCPTTPYEPPDLQMILSSVPATGTVVVDCAKRTVTVTSPDPDTGEQVDTDGMHLIQLPDGRGLEWIEVRDCDSLFCIYARTQHPCSQGGDTYVTIQTQLREG